MIPHDREERRALIGEYLLGLLEEPEATEVRQLLEEDEDAARIAYLDLIDWIVRAKISVPPPGPAVTTNSTGRFGSKAIAGAATPNAATMMHAIETDVFI